MKKLLILLFALVISSLATGQTTLISPAGDGGFESGATLAANNWYAVNSTTDGWFAGSVPVPATGSNCAYISSAAGTTWTYNETSAIQHIYYDVIIPAGESKLTLTFKWKAMGEGPGISDWDNMKVFFGESSAIGTPTANTEIAATYQVSGAGASYGMYKLNSSSWNMETINLTGVPGAVCRLVFSWKSDMSDISNPPAAIDDVTLLSMTTDPLHGIYTIDNTLPTTNPMLHNGTDNFNSFTEAINYINSEGITAGVTFKVSAGQVFNEDCPAITATGTLSNPIVFMKSGAGMNPVIRPTGTTGTYDAGILIHGGDYITFDGIDIAIAIGTAVEFGYLIRNASASNGAQHNTIINSKVTLNRYNNSSKGIYQYRAATATDVEGTNSYNVFRKVTVENSYMGIYLYGSSAYPDRDCVIDSGTFGAASANDIGNGAATSCGIRASYQSGTVIAYNTVRNVTTTALVASGIFVEAGQGAIHVYNNIVHSIGTTSVSATNYVYGIRVDINSGYTANVYNNMVSDLYHGISTPSTTISIRGLALGVSGTGTANFYYNSVLISENAMPSVAAFYFAGGYANLLNNILYNASAAGGNSKRYCIYRSGGTLSSNYNDLYISTGTNNFTGFYNAEQTSLAAWRTATGNQDMNSIASDPTFVSNTDLHTSNPLLNAAGYPVAGITFDIDGETRDLNYPDMGADENLSPPVFTCTTPAPGNTLATASTFCTGQIITLSLQHTITGTGVLYQWQQSPDGLIFVDISGAATPSFYVMPDADTYYRCIVTCQNGPVSTTSTPVLLSLSQNITSVTPGSHCGLGSVTLSATAIPGAVIKWYNAADSLLGTGSPWATPLIDTTTAFYVEAETYTASTAGRPSPAATTGASWSNFGLVFSASRNIIINAVKVYPVNSAPALMTIRLLNSSGMQVAGTSDVVFMPNSGTGTTSQTVALNYDVPAGTDYKLIIVSGMNTANKLVQETTGFAYPITSGAVSITSNWNNGAASTLYYDWFYDWDITELCTGTFTEVVATIATPPVLTLTAGQTLCNNAAGQIAVSSPAGNFDTYVWSPASDLFTDPACTMTYSSGTNALTVYVKTASAGTTVYSCTALDTVSQCADMAAATVTVLPASITATASPSFFCVSGSSVLTAGPLTGFEAATLQWQRSSDNIVFADIPGADSSVYITGLITDTTYYKLLIKLGTSVCTETDVLVVSVSPIPTAPLVGLITQPSCTMATGSVELTGLIGGSWVIEPGNHTGTGTSVIISGLATGTHNFTISKGNCVSDWSADVVINAQPVVPIANAGADAAYAGIPVQIGDVSSGPGTFSWSPATGLSNPAVSQPLASPATTTTYTLTVDNGVCAATDDVTIYFGYVISGKTRYAAKALAGASAPNIPTYEPVKYTINNVVVILKSMPAGNEVARDTSDAVGVFEFVDVPDGDYILSYDKYAVDSMQMGNSINAIDVALMKYLIGHDTTSDPSRNFSLKHRKAANVDNNSSINSLDVARLRAKIGQPYNPAVNFPKGNWVAFDTLVNVSGANLNVTLQTLCYGDYDASSSKYQDSAINWNMTKTLPESEIIIDGDEMIVKPKPELLEIPLRISTKVQDFAALGLDLNYPAADYRLRAAFMPSVHTKGGALAINPSLEEVIASNDDLLVTDENGKIRVVFATTEFFETQANDQLITFVFEPLKDLPAGILEFNLTGTGIIGNQYGAEVTDAFLLMPKFFIQGDESPEMDLNISGFPNPFSDQANIVYQIPDDGNVILQVYNVLGALVAELENGLQQKGTHKVVFDAEELPAGLYSFKLVFDTGNKIESKVLKLVH